MVALTFDSTDGGERVKVMEGAAAAGPIGIAGGKLYYRGRFQDLNTYLVKDTGKNPLKTVALRSRYYCVTTDQLKKLLKKAGFVNVRILKDRFFQEVLIASKADLK